MGTYENFDEQKKFACRVVADHARSTAFAIADGILPGNEGRAYVLRKIMRRAIYHGREHLGFQNLFFYKVCDFVVEQMKDAYPELETQREFIGKMVRLEEERFRDNLDKGLKVFEEELEELISISDKIDEIRLSNEYSAITAILRNKPIPPKRNEEDLEQEISDTKQKHFEKFGSGPEYEKIARLIHKYKIPPYLFRMLFENLEDKNEHFGDKEEYYSYIASELRILLGLEGNPEEKELARYFLKFPLKNFLTYLDIKYGGTAEDKYPNFLDFAKIYDTYGFPRDLIRLKLEEYGIKIDEIYFNESLDVALKELQKQSAVGKTERKSVVNPIYHEIAEKAGANQFHGYETTRLENAKVAAIVKNDEQIGELKEGEEGLIVLDQTPFYAEAGGQVGDTGYLINETIKAKVQDTFAPVANLILHKSKVEKGAIKIGDTVTATVDAEKRDATRRNHTATHLVHAALKEVLGTHVKQAGSVVAPNYLRFDFTHYQPLSDAEIKEIEDLVNRYILQNEPVQTNVMAIEEAMRSGAVALFGEKYGADVRVLSVGEGVFSKELCGGTHVRATGDIGSFKITSDEAIASGVRRIRAITGFDAFERFREDERLIEKSLSVLRTQRDQLPNAIERLQEELKRARREVEDLKMKIATGAISTVASNGDEAKEIGGVKVVTKIVEGLDKGGMRHLSDTLMTKIKSGVVVLGRADEDKVSFIVRVSDDLTDRIKAGKIVQEIAPIVSGRGGGKPDMAEGGGTDASKLGDALEASRSVIEKMLDV